MAYKRWSLIRDSKYSDLTWKLLVLNKYWLLRRGGRLREMVATGDSTALNFTLTNLGCVPWGWSGSGSVIQDLSGSWCIKGTCNRCPAGIHPGSFYVPSSQILIQIIPKECTLVFICITRKRFVFHFVQIWLLSHKRVRFGMFECHFAKTTMTSRPSRLQNSRQR